jgi:hypothetical protein
MLSELVARPNSRTHDCNKPVLNEEDLHQLGMYSLPEFIPDGSNNGATVYVMDPVGTMNKYGNLGYAATLRRRVDSFPYWCDRFPHIFGTALREHGATQAHGVVYQYLRHIGMLYTHQVSALNQPATSEAGKPVVATATQQPTTEVK